MGAGLIQSDGRISSLESDLSTLSTAYLDLMEQFRDIRTAAVFAVAEPSTDSPNYLSSVTGNGSQAVLEPVTPSVPTPVPVTPPPQEPPPTPTPIQTPEPTDETPTAHQEYNLNHIPETYTVQPGDSLGYISLRFFGTFNMVDRIMELNGITDPDSVMAGVVLQLPR